MHVCTCAYYMSVLKCIMTCSFIITIFIPRTQRMRFDLKTRTAMFLISNEQQLRYNIIRFTLRPVTVTATAAARMYH